MSSLLVLVIWYRVCWGFGGTLFSPPSFLPSTIFFFNFARSFLIFSAVFLEGGGVTAKSVCGVVFLGRRVVAMFRRVFPVGRSVSGNVVVGRVSAVGPFAFPFPFPSLTFPVALGAAKNVFGVGVLG